jgi:ketosteroid isomerase-like protein
MDDIYRINVAKTEFREAYQAGDVDRLLSVFGSGGFTDMSDGGPSKYGEEAKARLRENAANLFSEYSVKLNVIVIDIVVQKDSAYDYGWHEFILKPKSGGEAVRNRQRYFELWSKGASGAWTISFFINNPDVREELNGSVSRWFMSEEIASEAKVAAEKG